jgi:hypothetical protein
VDVFPSSFLAGDRNLGTGPDVTTAFDSSKAADQIIGPLDVNPIAISWTTAGHSAGAVQGSGNLLLGDGSVQEFNSSALRAAARNAQDTGNFKPGSEPSPSTNYFRLIIP